jgi:DNA-binding transcriptional LysR family regulator
MTLEQLRAFLAVARMGGVRKAAEQMNISQPAISARISSLEDYLGTRLFSRETTGRLVDRKGRGSAGLCGADHGNHGAHQGRCHVR